MGRKSRSSKLKIVELRPPNPLTPEESRLLELARKAALADKNQRKINWLKRHGLHPRI